VYCEFSKVSKAVDQILHGQYTGSKSIILGYTPEIYQKLGDQLGFARALARMGALNIHQLVYDEAQKFVLRSMPLFKDFHDAVGNAFCQLQLAMIELAHGQFENATTLANQALVEFQKTDDFGAQVTLLTMLGTISMYQNKLEAAQNHFNQAEMLLDVHQSNAGRPELYCECGMLCECRGDFAGAEKYYKHAQDMAQQCEHLEQTYLARLNIIKINLYFAPGRWYYEELLKIANEARTYGLKIAQLQALLLIVWFEGVYGEQRTWENLMTELTRFVQSTGLPVHGMLRIFEFKAEVLRYVSPEISTALHRSAGWIRQYLSQGR
jgi:tetratricopeptide (TPR) repeat protein